MHPSRILYGRFLRKAPRRAGAALAGYWDAAPDDPPDRLLRAIQEAEQAPGTKIVKKNRGISVMRTSLLGFDVIIKRYDLHGFCTKLRYFFPHPSRARRSWATGHTFLKIGIPTPAPLGFLEIYRMGVPVRSYTITAFVADAGPAKKWLKRYFDKQSPEVREAVRRDLLDHLLELYRKGVYHKDTKTANLLLRAPADSSRRAFYWIDLECVRFGLRITRHRIIRNLVQLNGSLGSRVPDEDRMEFLRDLSVDYPWVLRPSVIRRIRTWTQRRVQKELRLWCGS